MNVPPAPPPGSAGYFSLRLEKPGRLSPDRVRELMGSLMALRLGFAAAHEEDAISVDSD